MMKTALIAALLATVCWADGYSQPARQPIDFVNPNIGTAHSRWFFYTPAAAPFGMAKLAPSTNGTLGNVQGWEAVGYEDTHSSIEGFACLHEFQVGGILLMPVVGDVVTVPGTLDGAPGYRSPFEKADEHASAGYYAVRLARYDVLAELTATERVGFQRYTFPETDAAHILFDIGSRLGESGAVTDASITVNGNTVEGYVVTQPEYVKKYQAGASVSMYFSAEVSKAPVGVQTFRRGEQPQPSNSLQGEGAGAVLSFNTQKGEQIEVKIGLSYTSVDNARLNRNQEAGALNFDEARRLTQQKWNGQLSRILVEGANDETMTKFYTGLFHALLGRGVASDVNGAYPRNDGSIGQIPLDESGKPRFRHFNTDAVWGAYWNLGLLWALAWQDYYSEFISSQLLVYDDAAWLGDGIATSKYVSGVGTNMMSVMFAGAYASGIRNFDIEKAYAAARKNELEWRGRIEGAGKMDVGEFVRLGYSPFDDSVVYGTHPAGSQFSASHTLEYSFSAYAMAGWAKALGKRSDVPIFRRLARGWEKLFDDSTRLIRPKTADGKWIGNFNPSQSWRGFQEGNALQYTYFVPGDPAGLIKKIGRKQFVTRLDSIFTVARQSVFGGGLTTYAFSGVESPYNHGNQPSLHISWLFNFAGAPWLTQCWTRRICDEFYGADPIHGYGYGQDEDQGQLGAWYVMAAMGLFDVQGGASFPPTFQLGSPQFRRITIATGAGQPDAPRFIIETTNNAPDHPYIQRATLNGKPYKDCFLLREDVFRGGVLQLDMGAAPNASFGVKTAPFYSR